MGEGLNLKNRLIENHLSFTWLIGIMRRKGFEIDKSTVSAAVNGSITGDRVTKIINLGHEILDEYEKVYLSIIKSW